MAWHERTKEAMREEFVKKVLEHKDTKTALCREYGISRPTGDKWIQRYLENEPLCDQSRKPHITANRISDNMESLIVQYRLKYPVFGAAKLRRIMLNDGVTSVPCAKTINNVLNRHGLITREASQAATPYTRFNKSRSNEMWQADYKGHFRMENAQRCHPLNIIDDYSRFNLCCEAQSTETFQEIQPVMIRLFREYGMPETFLCDNGNPWGTSQSVGFTAFEVWMMELGILVLHGRPRHPQTQGKDESFNRSFTRECLKLQTFQNMNDAQQKFDAYRQLYNNIRPHHALEMAVPSSRYEKSQREYPKEIIPWEYGDGYTVVKVKDTGYFNFRGQGYFLSEGFRGKKIGIRASHIVGQFTLEFRQFKIARLDPEQRVITSRRAYLKEGDPRAVPLTGHSTSGSGCQG